MVRLSDDSAVRIVDATYGISGPGDTRSGALFSRRDKTVRPEDTDKAHVPEPFKAPEPIRRTFPARLNYDPQTRDVFLEILDPETGDVLRRLPAEQAAEDESSRHGGAILNQLA